MVEVPGKLPPLLAPYSGPAGVPKWTLCFGAYLPRTRWGVSWVFRASGGHFGSLSSIMTGLQYLFLISMFSEQVYLHFGGFFFYIIWPYFTWDTLNRSYSGLHSLISVFFILYFGFSCDSDIFFSPLWLPNFCFTFGPDMWWMYYSSPLHYWSSTTLCLFLCF